VHAAQAHSELACLRAAHEPRLAHRGAHELTPERALGTTVRLGHATWHGRLRITGDRSASTCSWGATSIHGAPAWHGLELELAPRGGGNVRGRLTSGCDSVPAVGVGGGLGRVRYSTKMRKSSHGATAHQRGAGGRRCDNGMAVLWYLEGLSGGSESTFEVGWCCTTYARGWKGGEMSCPRWTMVAEIDAPQLCATLGPLHATSPSPKLPLAGVMPPLRHPLDELACRPLPPSFLVLRQVSKLLLNVQDLAEDPPNTSVGRHRCTGAVHGEPHPPPSSSQSDAPLPDPPCLASVPHLREASDEDRC
jgi:hypothetical protein